MIATATLDIITPDPVIDPVIEQVSTEAYAAFLLTNALVSHQDLIRARIHAERHCTSLPQAVLSLGLISPDAHERTLAHLAPRAMRPVDGDPDIQADRRRSPRVGSQELQWVRSAKLRPGKEIALVNLSAGGALIEAYHRMLPGSRVIVQLQSAEASIMRQGALLRCHVHEIDPKMGIRYRGALTFDEPLDLARPSAGNHLSLVSR